MTNVADSNDRAGWEAIWRSGDIPPKYRSASPPNSTVVEWADTLPVSGFVLDVGCGIGRHCLYMGGRGFKMAGVDLSPTGVQITQTLCAERQIDFEGYVSLMTIIPWADNTFDGAFSTSTLHHNLRADIVKSLDEVKRVLKPGGLLLVDFPSTDRPDYPEMRRQVAAGELQEPEPNTFIDEGPRPEDQDAFLPHHYSDEADVRDMMRSFEIIRLWADPPDMGKRGKWVVSARKPRTG